MTFRDYLCVSGRDLAPLDRMHPTELQSQAARQLVESVTFDVDQYDIAWQEYLTCGGFPRAVAEQIKNGGVSLSYTRDLHAWISSDVEPDGSGESVANLLAGLEVRSSSPINVRDTALRLGYDRSTFERRLARLEGGFAGIRCPQRHGDTGDAVAGSQSKFYLTDPLLAWLPGLLRAGVRPPDMTRLTEMTLGITLARTLEESEEGRWSDGNSIGFTRTGSGNEVDFSPVPIRTSTGTGMTVPIESKWVDDGWRGEARVLTGKYGRGILATKSILALDDSVWAIPAPLLALLLK